MVLIATIGIGLVIFLVISLLGGIGLTSALFSGLASIPQFIWLIIMAVVGLKLIGWIFKK